MMESKKLLLFDLWFRCTLPTRKETGQRTANVFRSRPFFYVCTVDRAARRRPGSRVARSTHTRPVECGFAHFAVCAAYPPKP